MIRLEVMQHLAKTHVGF